jgi:hypothetical protein
MHGSVSVAGRSPHGVPRYWTRPMSTAFAGGKAAAASGCACHPASVWISRWLPRSVVTFQPRRSGASRRTYSLVSSGRAVSAGPRAGGPTASPIAVQCAPSSVVICRPSAVATTVVSPRMAMPDGITYCHSGPSWS